MDKDKLIAKLEELVDYYHVWANVKSQSDMKVITRIESEIVSLKAEVEKEKQGRNCLGCGDPLGNYCDRCQHLLES
jgi:hypothetical protein